MKELIAAFSSETNYVMKYHIRFQTLFTAPKNKTTINYMHQFTELIDQRKKYINNHQFRSISTFSIIKFM